MFGIRFVLGLAAMAACFTVAAYRSVDAAPLQRQAAPYTFDVPAGWTATAVGGDGTVVAHGDAYVRIVKVAGGAQDESLVKKVVDQIGEQWMRFKQDSRGLLKLDGNQGIYLFVSGVNPKGVEATMRIDAAPFGEDAYMLIMSAPSDAFVRFQPAFQQIEKSFAMSSGRARSKPSSEAAGGSTPTGFKVVDEAGGGRILFTPLSGVSSGPEAFRSGLARIRGYFDESPKLLSGVASKDHNLTVSVFNATLKGSPVTGLATAAYDPEGNSDFAIVFDSSEHLKSSLAPMMRHVSDMALAAIERSKPAASGLELDFARFNAEAAHVALTSTQYPGGIGSVGIAAGYTPHLQGTGTAVALGDDGSYMNVMGFDGMCDPRGSLYKSQHQLELLAGPNFHPTPDGRVWIEYDPNPVTAWKKFVTEHSRLRGTEDANPQVLRDEAMKGVPGGWTGRLVSGTMTVRGETFAFTGSLMTSPPPPPVGSWSLSITILAAPIKNAAKDFPALIAMQKSVHLDVAALRDHANRFMARMNEQTAQWMAENRAAGDAARNRSVASSMEHARATRDTMDRSTAGFINHILDRSVVRHEPTGAHATLDSNLASALERSDPQNLTPVPISQYVKGVDY
ncbi:MAG TPA: hypothetical protein VKT77_21725 [Chthonomonadaceae bacterium]|nr:hypothetical protein [Chthonomonadaceae bacterium]